MKNIKTEFLENIFHESEVESKIDDSFVTFVKLQLNRT